VPTLPRWTQPTGDTLGGVLLALANALTVALSFLAINRILRQHDTSPHASAWQISGALLFLLVLVLLRGLNLPPSPSAWIVLLLLAAISTVLPIFTLTAGIQKF